ncbi:zinc finger (CCCH type) protein, putative [Eimeria necatrix]|uniref:Zinc finger (CCCH type) protein, putative n=1 Tax=Eimeria necatrix TaxID=51315 RepID=U6MTQ4_9EIME|nr:zinc finger (CCCH type) protein, putative [Eimeria necatrix]CDJ67577.1 zinc finger (CCCH type) protein, putative [Eimeria necatrix]
MMAHREQPQTQQHQTQSFLPDNSLPQDLLLLQQLAMQQAQGKLSSFSSARQQQHQQQQMLQQHQQLLMLLEAEAAGKAALAAQDRQKAQVARRQQQQQQYQEQPQQHLKRQLQDPQRRCIASELDIQHGQQQEQPDVLPSYHSKMAPGTLQPQQKKQEEPTLQQEAGSAARSPGALHFRSPASKVPAFSLRALATTQQQVQQDSEEQLLENLQSSDNWNELPPMMQLPANAAEGTEQQQQQQQQQQSELEDIVSRQQSMQQRLLLQQQALPSGYQQTFPDTALQHGWQRPAAGSADEAQGTATTAAAPGYTYRELSSWGQAVSRSTASTATGDDCYSFASLAAAAAVRKAEQGLKVPTPESLQRQQKPLTQQQQQQPQVLQKLPQQSLTRQGHELLQAVELLRQQHQQQQGEHERKEANWALQAERCSADVAPAVSPFGSYSLRELQNRMTALTLQPQQQQQEDEPLEQTRQRQQHHLEQHRQIEGLLARLSREQTEGIGKQLGGDSLSSVDTQQQQQHQQQIEQQQLFPKLQLPSGVTGTAPASYRLGKSPLHRPDGEDTPCVQHSASHPTSAAIREQQQQHRWHDFLQ